MNVFIACLGTETNTFSPLPTAEAGFREWMLYRGDATKRPENLFSAPLHVWRQAAEAQQATVTESLSAFAQPAGITVRKVYEGFRDEILADLKAAMPVDLVLLSMHGAMVADGYDDCEGDLLEKVRAIVGPKAAVGAELDLHCSITEKMLANADALITFKEYPHTDSKERAQELYNILLAKHQGVAKPVMAVFDTRMINLWRTPVEPMTGFVREMQAREGKDGILSVSFAHGFPMQDVPDATAKMIVIADGDAGKAAAVAEEFGRKIWNLREQTATQNLSIDVALDRATAATVKRPVVLADVTDNPGGGAPGDATFILRRIIERGIENVVSGLYWDPMAVRFCCDAGEGAVFDLRLGGKCGPTSGDPLDLNVTVKRIITDGMQPALSGAVPIGDAVWLQFEGNRDLVLISTRTQTFHPGAFTQFGIDVAKKAIIVVKSTQHFHAGFAPIAGEILHVQAPGAMRSDFADIPFQKVRGPYWPRVADPFAAE
ncbi:M81 family metallopeptidase [Ferrovibrio terrae]|uniref:M81 family metallopeptidase n=1 Tax=Ferrovibrio terrae TaxID=2594003 RepID=UPI003137FB7A